MPCIWCLHLIRKASLEHGIPEALGCPEDLELHDVCCTSCNNRLGVLDQALLKQFELLTVMYGVPRKKGRPPTIDGWRGLTSKHKPDGPHIFLNAGPAVQDVEGKPLHPVSKKTGIQDVWVKPESGAIGFRQKFGNDPRFVRALYKVGLNLVAKHYGPEEAAAPRYDHVRRFVQGFSGAIPLRAMMYTETVRPPVTSASLPIMKAGRSYPLFQLTILGVALTLDMAPDQQGMTDLHGAATLLGERVCMLPPRKAA